MSSYKARVEYSITTANTLTFNFPFSYLKKSFIGVKIRDSANKETTLTYGTDYTINDLAITLVSAPAVGTTLIIYRQTATDKIVSWNDGSILLAADMNVENVQMLHLQEEQQDYLTANSIATKTTTGNEGVWDGNGKRLTDLADPTEEQDAVTKNYMESVQSGFVQQNTALKNEATKQATAAAVSAANAKTSETNSKTSETHAATSAAAAKVSETNSKTSETNSKTSETNAKTSETNAKTSETKAAVSKANAKNSETNAKSSETKSKDSENAARVSEQNAAESARVATENAMDFNMLKRNKAYSIGDITYSSYLPSWARLECVTVGTTADTVPSSLTTVSSGGILISDGTVTWIVDDVRDMTPIGCVRGSLFLPKGYIKANGATVQRADYPRLVHFIEINNLWTDDTTNNTGLFGKGDGSSSTFVLPDYRERMMQYTDDSIGAKRNAGLPNITGTIRYMMWTGEESAIAGSFRADTVPSSGQGAIVGSNMGGIAVSLDASRSCNIYGSSSTVQPPAINVIPILRY